MISAAPNHVVQPPDSMLRILDHMVLVPDSNNNIIRNMETQDIIRIQQIATPSTVNINAIDVVDHMPSNIVNFDLQLVTNATK